MRQFEEATLEKIQKQIDLNCPSPEDALVKLGYCVAMLPSNQDAARLRHLVLDVDDLTAQIRWHLGQALLILDTKPDILRAGEDDNEFMKGLGMPIGAQLLLRKQMVSAERVVFDDLSAPRRGGTVGGWIFHMMIDSAVYRTVSALDRLASILWYAANLPKEHVYFRSGKIRKLHKIIQSDDTANLLRIAEGKILQLVIDYRDGLTHTVKAYSRTSGFTPSEQWRDERGRLVVWNDNSWDAEMLFALGRASYLQFKEALEACVNICEKKWPIPTQLQ